MGILVKFISQKTKKIQKLLLWESGYPINRKGVLKGQSAWIALPWYGR
jgi:hypothetical protein